MDVNCSTCDEPWDTYHLWHDAIYDTNLEEEAIDAWNALPSSQKLSPFYRQAFLDSGFEFGASVVNVKRCPSCPKDAKPNPEREATKAALEDLMGEDQDGLAAAFEDYNL
jgi:hypothetical protein